VQRARFKRLIRDLQRDERGLSTVEYVVLLVLIVAIAVALWNVFGNLFVSKLSAAATEFDQEVVTSKVGSEEETNAADASEDINDAAGGQGAQGAVVE
jgi:Flp pilus assembly pilin Flp